MKFSIFLLILCANTAFACFGLVDPGDLDGFDTTFATDETPGIPETTLPSLVVVTSPPAYTVPYMPESEEPMKRLVGDGITINEYDPAGYNMAAGGPVEDGDQLYCDFNGPCCFINIEPPVDQLEWMLASGAPDEEKIQANFGPFGRLEAGDYTPLPSKNYLFVGTNGIAASDEAQLVSCTIGCSKGVVKVSARHWHTENALLTICTRDSFFNEADNAPLFDCVRMEREESPGPTTVKLPRRTNFDIVFIASNLIGDNGEVILVDDIDIEYTPCAVTKPPKKTTPFPTTKKPKRSDPPECGEVMCDFEDDEGKSYMAIYLAKKGDAAYLETKVKFSEDRVIRFLYFEGTSGIQFEACCDNRCPFKSQMKQKDLDYVEEESRKWNEASILCSKRTKTISFRCKATNKHVGACGVDDIRLFVDNGDEPEYAEDKACRLYKRL